MKIPVERHKESLANMRDYANRLRDEATRKTMEADRLAMECLALDAQIIRAELEGVDAFDSEKYGKKRRSTEPQNSLQKEK